MTALQYANGGVITEVHLTPTDSLPIPEILICPTNNINYTKLKDHANQALLYTYMKNFAASRSVKFAMAVDYMRILFNNPENPEAARLQRGLEDDAWERAALEAEDHRADEFFLGISKDPERVISACMVGEMMPWAEGCHEHVKPVFDVSSQVCFRLTFPSYMHQTQGGRGAAVLIDLNRSNDPPWLHKVIPQAGPAFRLGTPVNPCSKEVYWMMPGHSTQANIKVNEIKLLDHGGERCVNNADFSFVNTTYSSECCIADCYIQAIYEECGCVVQFDTNYINEKYREKTCTGQKLYDCVRPFYTLLTCVESQYEEVCEDHELFTVEKMKRLMETLYSCVRGCKQGCNIMKYDVSVTYTKFPISTGNYTDFDYHAAENLALLEVDYSSLVKTVTKQRPAVTGMTFVSNLGGQLGLWLGASMLSLLHVIFYVIFKCCEKGE